jgi:predicted acylesterase/phospholipase RssA
MSPTAIPKPERVAVLLSGGTAFGAVQVHSMEQIVLTHGKNACYWAGVSVGAQHALLCAQGRVSRARELWNEMDGVKFFIEPAWGEVWRFVRTAGRDPIQGIYSLKPLHKRIVEELAHPILAACEVGVVDYERGPTYRQVNLGSLRTNGQRAAALCASAAQPAIMAGWKVQFDGHERLCFDGGVKHVVPMLSNPDEFDVIYVVLCSPAVRRGEPMMGRKLDGLLEIAMRSAEAWTDAVVDDDIARLKRWAQLGRDSGRKVVLIAPSSGTGDAFDASRETIQKRLNEIGPAMWEARATL